MKKGKLIIGLLAFFTAMTGTIAFKTSRTLPVSLYYFNSDSVCMTAPCETINHTNKVCLVTMYTDSNCRSEYKGTIWIKNGDQ